MAPQSRKGILAIWNDCRPGSEDDYETWYRTEHLRERVAIPGFIGARRYLAADGSSPKYFTSYLTDSADILRSPAYLERGANPTAMTRHIMSTCFQNMTRSICERTLCVGEAEGSAAIVIRATGNEAAQRLGSAWAVVTNLKNRFKAELWRSAEPTDYLVSAEEQIRGGDKKIDACLVVGCADVAQASDALAVLSTHLEFDGMPGLVVGTYQLICTLRQSDLA